MSSEYTSINATSKIEKVTLYENKAQVQRNAEVDLTVIAAEIILDDLPSNINRDSLQCNVFSLVNNAPDVVLKGLAFDTKTVENGEYEVLTEKQKDAVKRLEEIEYELQECRDQITAIKDEDTFLDKCFQTAASTTCEDEGDSASIELSEDVDSRPYEFSKLHAKKARSHEMKVKKYKSIESDSLPMAVPAPRRSTAHTSATPVKATDDDYSLEMWSKMLDHRTNAKETALAQQRGVEAKMEKLNVEKDALTPVAQTTPWRSSTRNIVKVLVSSSKPAGKIAIELTYMIDDASWAASYEMRVDSESGDVKVGFNAVLKQSTQEAWDEVEIELSTAKPSLSGKQPELKPWRLNIAPAYNASYRSKKSKNFDSGYSLENQLEEQREILQDVEAILERGECLDAICESLDTMAVVEEAEVDSAATSVTFKVPGKHTISRDGKETRVAVTQLQVTSTLSFVTVPKDNEHAFALAHATNTSEYLLVEGAANIFLDGHYVTKSSHPRTAPGDTFDIGVGVDDTIAVVYKKISRVQSKEGGFLSGKKSVLSYKYLTKISNHKKVPVRVVLKDQIPVSQDEKVTIEQIEPAKLPKRAFPKEDGVWEKSYELAAGETKEIPIHYEVHYPRDEQMYGLK